MNSSHCKVLSAGLVALFVLASGCNSPSENAPPISAELLLELLPFGELVQLHHVANIDPDYNACILFPYHDRLDEGQPQAKLVNDYLVSIRYQGTETEWSIVWIKGNAVSVTRVKQRDLRLHSAKFLDLKLNEDEWSDFAQGAGCSPVPKIFAYRSVYTSSFNQKVNSLALISRSKM